MALGWQVLPFWREMGGNDCCHQPQLHGLPGVLTSRDQVGLQQCWYCLLGLREPASVRSLPREQAHAAYPYTLSKLLRLLCGRALTGR